MPPQVTLRPQASLPGTELPWLALHDHFVATVGPRAGEGQPLGPLLVLADARFSPRSRFPLHPHRDLEILTLVVEGELSHHGDQAHGAVVKAREAVLISARDGIVHAEGNDTDRPTHILQIWFVPSSRGGRPGYYHRKLPSQPGNHLLAGDEQMPMRCDARVWWLDLTGPTSVELQPGRAGYLLAVTGSVQLAQGTLGRGDGAELQGTGSVEVTGTGVALWIDLAAA